MLALPIDFTPEARPFWTPRVPSGGGNRPDDISIVTAFFDIGRGSWADDYGTPQWLNRTTDRYFECFGRLAKIKNQLAVFVGTEEHASRALCLRQSAGQVEHTAIYVVPDLFNHPLVRATETAILRTMSPEFRRKVKHPESPEYNFPRYNLVNALKGAFAVTAIRGGAVNRAQTAWIDFGYCVDDERFDQSVPWRFDAGPKMNMFNLRRLDHSPIPKIVRSGEVYFQGCHIVGPTAAWEDFARETDISLSELIAADLADDDQTMMLMNYRRNPDRYTTRATDPKDWKIIFREFSSGVKAVPPPNKRFFSRLAASLIGS